MTTYPPSYPEFEMRHSPNAIVDLPVPKFMSVEHFCATYHCAISEIEIVRINGSQFVDLESSKAKLVMLRAKFK
jgi:hypothetical protein